MNRYPPFCAAPDHATRDVSSKDGAHRLAAEIRSRWAKCGVHVETEVYETAARPSDSYWGVRITGLNGGLSGPA